MRKTIIIWAFVIFTLIAQSDCQSQKQKDVLRLLRFVNNPDCFERRVSDNLLKKRKRDVVYLIGLYSTKNIGHENDKPNEIFSVFNAEHLQEAKKLFDRLMKAKDYQTFYDIAASARKRVNPGLFVYAFTTAVLFSKHTKDDVIIPPFYEVNPYYFINGDAIKKAINRDTIIEIDEGDLRYFTEDVGLNAYYYYINLMLPFWLDDAIKPEPGHNGQYFLYLHQQLLARYNLERYSLGLGPTPSFSYENPIKSGYISNLLYPDGRAFPSREDNVNIFHSDELDLEFSEDSRNNAYTYVKDNERRWRDFLNDGNLKVEELAHLMGINIETLKNFVALNPKLGSFNYPRIILGNPTKTFDVPSALEHYETSLRDPMFWQMTKRMLYFYHRQFNLRTVASQSNMCVSGVHCWHTITYDDIRITNLSIDYLETYFEDFKIDLSNAIQDRCGDFERKASMKRLNHKPFSYKITIDPPTKYQNIFVKVFLGPKYDQKGIPISLRNNRFNFVEIDRFLYIHKSLDNVPVHFTRYSTENKFYSNDRTSYQEFSNRINEGFVFKFESGELTKYYGFPRRLMLPKGSPNGTIFQLYVIAAPNSKAEPIGIMKTNEFYYNYPFNKLFSRDEDLLGSNIFVKDVVIYHK